MDNFQNIPPAPGRSVFPQNFGPSSFIPEQSPMQTPVPSRPKRTRLFIFLGAFGAGVIIAVVFIFVVFLEGKTALGKSFQDKIWQSWVETSSNKPTQFKASMVYTDAGSFSFVPSKALAALDFPASSEDAAKMDKDYSFTLQGLSLTGAVNGFINLTDTQHLKIDAHSEGSLSNAGTTYSATFDAKLKDKQAYVKYGYNDALQNFILKLDPTSTNLAKQKDQWLKLPEFDSSTLEELGKTISLQGDPTAKARDAKRLADVRQLQSALELYYNDKGGYPEAEGGKPSALMSTYLSTYPSAPTPVDGKCLDQYNGYIYTAKGSPKQVTSPSGPNLITVYPDYELTFCLGDKTGGTDAGNQVATPAGIKPMDCPSGMDCYKAATDVAKQQNIQLDILKRNRIFEIKSFKGFSLQSGSLALHYQLSLDKDKFKSIILETSKANPGYIYSAAEQQYLEQFADILLQKLQIDDYEIWVGAVDHRVYKTVFKSNALSVTKTLDLIYQKILSGEVKKALEGVVAPAQAAGLDAERLADIRQFASALELYYNDNSGYPDASGGRPVGLAPVYLTAVKNAPTPPGGTCSVTDNYYVYTPVGDPKLAKNTEGKQVKVYPKYKYTFCLGNATGGLASGLRTMTEAGIDGPAQTSGVATDNQTSIDENSQRIQNFVLDIFRALPFDAKLTIETEINNYGKDQDVPAPPNTVDLNTQTN